MLLRRRSYISKKEQYIYIILYGFTGEQHSDKYNYKTHRGGITRSYVGAITSIIGYLK